MNRWLTILLVIATLSVSPVSAQGDGTPVSDTVTGLFEVEPGRSLYLHCEGVGSPTVIFESGVGADSTVWRSVAPSIATVTRACIYDRAGLGRSDPAPEGTRTIQDSADDLSALLAEAEIEGPYVLVGASLGGQIVRLYGGQHPESVAGFVLVDGLPPGVISSVLVRLPPELVAEIVRGDLGRNLTDAERIDVLASDELAAIAPLPPRVPTIVLASETLARDLPENLNLRTVAIIQAVWQQAQRTQAEALGGRLVTVTGSGHNIHQERPDVVIAAISDVVLAARDPASWATPLP